MVLDYQLSCTTVIADEGQKKEISVHVSTIVSKCVCVNLMNISVYCTHVSKCIIAYILVGVIV